MPDRDFIARKKAARKKKPQWWCWGLPHFVPANAIVVKHGKRRGLCGSCVLRRTRDLASYWTVDWPSEWIGDVGKRDTWGHVVVPKDVLDLLEARAIEHFAQLRRKD